MKTLGKYSKLFVICGILFLASCTDENGPTDGLEDERDDFVGLWSVTENSSIFQQSIYDSEIIKNSSIEANVAIDNFYQLGENNVIQARVSGNTLTIFTQTTTTNQTIKGSGELIDKNTLEFNYTVDDGGGIDTVNSTYSRK